MAVSDDANNINPGIRLLLITASESTKNGGTLTAGCVGVFRRFFP
jgi:hypothetical protein